MSLSRRNSEPLSKPDGRKWPFFGSGKLKCQPTQPEISIDTLDNNFNKRKLKIQSKIASGACGDVYHGTYNDVAVAVKLFHQCDNTSQEELQIRQFNREVATLSRVDSPHVIKLIGSFAQGRPRGIVTEYMAGGNLSQYLKKRDKPLPLGQVLKMATDIAKGMSYLHRLDIIHRDLKSDNLLLDSQLNVKIADFNDSRLVGNGQDLTAEIGTCRWMAPEAITGCKYSSKVDVYSFGIVLWELLTGKTPFEGMSPVQVAFNVVTKNLRPSIPEVCPYDLYCLITTCWDGNPSKRPKFTDIITILESMLYFMAS